MTELKVPTRHDHDGPDWCRLTSLWLAQREGSTKRYRKGVTPRPCVLHFADHDERFESIREAANTYDLEQDSLWNLIWRMDKSGKTYFVRTSMGKAWPELLKNRGQHG